MNTYYSNQNLKKELLLISKEHIKKQYKTYRIGFICCFIFTVLIFLMNIGKANNIGLYLLASSLQSIFPIIIGIITYISYIRNTQRTYNKSDKETIVLYSDYIEYSYEIKNVKTTYKIPYCEICSLFTIEGYELVLLSRNTEVTYLNMQTNIKTVDNKDSLRRIEILYCFNYKEDMLNRIKEEVHKYELSSDEEEL